MYPHAQAITGTGDVPPLSFRMERPRVLLVAPDRARVARLHHALDAAGFAVTEADRAAVALRLVATDLFTAVLADTALPGDAAFALCGVARARRFLPVLLIGASAGANEAIRGIEAGADDCIARAATAAEVVGRLHAVLRRYPSLPIVAPARPAHLDCGRFVLDLSARVVTVAGAVVHFAPREYDLLHLFAAHPRRVFTRAQLFDRFWGGYGGLHTVAVHVSRIRTKIEERPTEPRLIVTVWGLGYRFEGGQS